VEDSGESVARRGSVSEILYVGIVLSSLYVDKENIVRDISGPPENR